MKRIYLDAAMLLLTLAVMSFHHLPKTMHEALGIALPVLSLLHLAANRAWFTALRANGWSLSRLLSTLVNVSLISSLFVVTVSGLTIAHNLFHGVFGLHLERSILAHQAHVTAAYWLMIFSGLHIGLHLAGLRARLTRFFEVDAASGLFCTFERVFASVTTLAGVYGSFLCRIGDRLMMKHVFGTAAMKLPLFAFLLLLLGIIGMYAVIGYLLQRAAVNRLHKKQGTI